MPKPFRDSARSGPRSERQPRASDGSEPTLETVGKRRRRVFSAADKLRIVKEADGCLASGKRGALGEMLRREGIYSSLVSSWRTQLGSHGTTGLAAKKVGRKPKLTEAERRIVELTKRNAQQWLAGTGTGVTQPRDGSQLWSAPRIDAGLGWTFPGTALRVGTQLTLAAPLDRKDFVLRDLGRVSPSKSDRPLGGRCRRQFLVKDPRSVDTQGSTRVAGNLVGTRESQGGPIGAARGGGTATDISPSTASLDFERAYEEHFDFVWCSLRLLGVPDAAAEDAAQETFSVVLRQLSQFEGRSALRTWIFEILPHVAANYRRTRARKLDVLSEFKDAPSPEPLARARRSTPSSGFDLALLREPGSMRCAASTLRRRAQTRTRPPGPSRSLARQIALKDRRSADTEGSKGTLLMANFSRQLHRFALSLVLASCSRGEVDLGQGTAPPATPRGARCMDSTVIDGAVVAHNQDEIAALAGCEEIHGDLYIRTFQGADLTPLSALRIVEGQLRLGAKTGETPVASIGAPVPESEGPSLPDATEQGDEAINAFGWLTSLAGLEGLESVGSLTLYLTSVPDLRALSHLTHLDGDHTGQRLLIGQLGLFQTHELRDFSGLEQAVGLQSINFQENYDIESLDGLNVPAMMSSVLIQANPTLTQIDAFAPLNMVTQYFFLSDTSIENLNGLGSLWSAQTVQIVGNDQLVDASALDPYNVDAIQIQANSLLKTVSFSNTIQGSGTNLNLEIFQNASLESVALDFSKGVEGKGAWLGQGATYGQLNEVEISDNKALTSIQCTGGLINATTFHVRFNDSLTALDLSSFQSFSDLTIDQNPTLTQVDIPSLQTVDALVVTNNQQLSTANFAAVRTFSNTMNGNADQAAAP